ncbi:MAG TPA: hypothetical protein VFN74_09120 [Chloroflexota bacterium]|nr:hypothetical protein [Chloroflexota bacterium]
MTRIWLWWIGANVVGEVVGFGAAGALMAALGAAVDGASGVAALVLAVGMVLVAGVVEGSAVGYAQWRMLRRLLPELPRGEWILASVAGGTLAWAAGMAIGTTAADLRGGSGAGEAPPLRLMLGGSALIGIVAGALLSAAQWLVLRRHARGTGWWVPAHCAGWAVGMVVAIAGLDPVFDSESVGIQIGGSVLVGLAMGASAAAISGLGLRTLAHQREAGRRSDDRRPHTADVLTLANR